ncbi:High mobility group B protein 15 [Platanthera guangdongensis]|uniref:High mobility group B protein 15 n=1 Tax=Platanthera guangdongensis TaxID=2320717 RepID=A0ABR2LKQ8_9ASPA
MGEVEDKGTEVMANNKGKELLEPKLSSKSSGDDEILPTSQYEVYPEALASYQEVVGNKTLFMESLEKLHFAMKTKFMIPTIGGKELELHQLFVEVTSRGGIEKVIADRRWREVTNAFNFPSTATNASFILRKYYLSLLRHYEQIYFFGAKRWSIPSAVPFRAMPTATFEPEKIAQPVCSFPETQFAMRKRRKANIEVAPTVTFGSELPPNQTVVGVIDGKFDDGYFVTVTVGGRKLKGVLFHASQQSAVKEQTILHGIGDDNGTKVIRRRRRRKNLSSRDPTHPKPNRSGYNFFFSEQRARLKLLHPGRDKEISKMIGDLWNNQTETERAVYQEIGLKDKQRYQREMAAYRENQRTALALSNMRAIQQAAPELSIKAQNADSKEEDDVDMLSEDCTDTDGEKSEEPEMPNSLEARIAAAPAAGVPLAFELRRRDVVDAVIDTEMGIKSNLPSSGEDAESGRVGQTSANKEWSEDERN